MADLRQEVKCQQDTLAGLYREAISLAWYLKEYVIWESLRNGLMRLLASGANKGACKP
jgi:hypothetical protein